MTPANEAARRNSQSGRPIAERELTVYAGQHLIGSVVERDGKFRTYDVDGLHVSVFANLRDATRALKARFGEA
jgi:hypothetical protein